MHPLRQAAWSIGLGLLAAWAGAPGARAELRFDKTEITLKPTQVGEATLTAEFAFTNVGKTAISLTEVHSGCLCTVPTRPEAAVEPGARGVLPVNFNTRGRQGLQRQTVQVKSSDGAVHALVLVVDLPVRVVFAPRLLIFSAGEATPKIATLTYGDDLPVELIGVEPDGAAFALAEPPRLSGTELKIAVRFAGDAAQNERGVLKVRTRGKSGTEYTDLLYARHRPRE